MAAKSPWPLPERFRLPWKLTSAAVILSTQLVTKIVMRLAQRVQAKNIRSLTKAISKRPRGTPLVTISNHSSCIDDPVYWSLLPLTMAFSHRTSRWIPAAREINFFNKLVSVFFSRGQLVPVDRGDGVYQRGMNFCLQMLNEGGWVHIFPEGKVNMTGESLRLKWGVGRLIAEARVLPVVVPFWLVGMEDILPNKRPYIPRLFKKLTVLVGEPMDFNSIVRQHKEEVCTSAVILRRQITDTIQDKMAELRTHAEALHRNWNVRSPVAFRRLK